MLADGFVAAPASFATPPGPAATHARALAAGLQYGTTLVSVALGRFQPFHRQLCREVWRQQVESGVFQVTPTPGRPLSRLVLAPSGTISSFRFKTPIPWPPAAARPGYLVADIETAMKVAREHGADGGVDMFPDPIGRARVDFRRTRTRGHTGRARCRSAARNTRSGIAGISNPQTLCRSVRPACLRASNGRHPGDRIQNLSSHPWDLSTFAAPNPCPDSPQ